MSDARACVTSAMLRDAKPIPAVTAKTKVMIQTAHPAAAVTRWHDCQREAAQDGHDKRNKISGHANGEKQLTGSIGRPEGPGEPAVHGEANAGERQRGDLQEHRGQGPLGRNGV